MGFKNNHAECISGLHDIALGAMMLDEQVIPVNFGQALDTKTDPKLVVVGKFLLVQNAVFTNPGQFRKRNGYTALPTAILGGGNLIAPNMIKEFGSELIVADSGNLYSYSQSLQAWILKGPYTSVDLSENFLYKETSVGGYVDCAVLGNYAVYCWSTEPGPTSGSQPIQTMATVIDLSTNTVLLTPMIVATISTGSVGFLETSGPRCVALGNSSLAITYYSTTANAVVMRILTISAGGVSFGGELPITNTIYQGGDQIGIPYDIVSTSSGAAVSYVTQGSPNFSYTTALINTSGTVTGTRTVTAPGNLIFTYLNVDTSTGNLWVYWIGNNGTNTIVYQVLSSSLSVILAPTIVASSLQNNLSQLCALPVSSTQQILYYTTINVGTMNVDQTWSVSVQSSGAVGTPSVFAVGVFPISRPFSYGSKNYIVFAYRGPLATKVQVTLFVLDLSTAAVVARFASGLAGNFATQGPNYIPNVPSPSSGTFLYGCGIEYQNLLNSSYVSGLIGAASVTLTFNSSRAYNATFSGSVLALNGAVVSLYDGQSCAELGFHLYPEVTVGYSGTGGNVGAGTYQYIVVYQWTDAQGNLHQSTPSNPVSLTIPSGTTNSVSVNVTMAYLSQKTNLNIAIFRTQSNQGVYYLVTDPVFLQMNNAGSYTLTFVDKLADTSLPGRQNLYTTGNVVENTTPPPSMILTSRINRLWLVDAENPNTLWYSKSYTPGTGISMSAEFIYQIDTKFGKIAAISEMDEKLVTFKDRGIAWFTGDGPDDTGSNGNLSIPQFVPSDAGCSSLKSLVLMPKGIIRLTQKGFYLLDRSLTDHYFDQYFDGAAVEQYKNQTFTAATLIDDKNQIRFLVSSGVTLVYDYALNIWGTFTNHLGLGAAIWNGIYTYVRTDGSVFQENTTSFLDGTSPFQLRVQTSWIALAGVQGFQRVRRVAMLGDYANGSSASHGVQISAAYDFGTSFSTPIQYLPGGANASGVLQYRERLPQQKCDSISLLIEEVVTGASGEYVDFTNLSFEAGLKKGIRKMQAAQSVG